MQFTPGTPTREPSGSWHATGRFVLAVVAALAAGVAAVGAVMLLLVQPRVSVELPLAVSPQEVVDANNSPVAVRDPTDSGTLVVVNRLDRPRFSAALHASRDGGRSWRTVDLPLPDGFDRPFAPDAAFSSDGVLYVVYLNLTGPANVPESLWLTTSDDGGLTLTDPVRIATGLAFQPRIAIGSAGSVHVTYLQASSVGAYQLTGPAEIVAVRSDDGRTFSEPVVVSDPDRPRVVAGVPVAANGELYVLYLDLGGDVRDVQDLDGPIWSEPFSLVVARSFDGGRSFGAGMTVDDGVVPTERFLVFLPEYPAFVAGPHGELYAAWSDGRSGDEDVYLRRSDDQGRTWTPPVRVNPGDGPDGTTQDMPAVAVAPDGRVDVVFYDRRRDPDDTRADVILAFSRNQGSRFHEVRLSEAPVSTRLGATARPYHEPDLGSRLAVVNSRNTSLAFWTDTGRADEVTLTQDILAARVDLSDLGRTSRWTGIVVAAALFAAVAWAGRWMLRRRVLDEDASA